MLGTKFTDTVLATAAAGALVVGLGIGAANAASIGSLIVGGTNAFSDEDREYLIDRSFAVDGVVGRVDVGDSLRGLVAINTLNSGSGNVGGVTPNNEWTGVFQAIVTSKTALGGGFFSYTFAPDPAFEASLCGGVTGCASAFVPGTGALVVMFEDATKDVALDFDDPAPAVPPVGPDDGTASQTVPPSSADVSTGPYATEEAFIATATDGTHFWTLGFSGPLGAAAAGEGWTALTTGLGDNVTAAFTFSSGVTGGTFNAGLSCIVSGSFDCSRILPITAGAFGPVDFAVSGTLRGVNDLDTPFEVSSDLNAAFFAIPEPATLGIMGIGLLGLGIAARRRQKRQA